MKSLMLILIVIVLCQNQSVNSTFLKFMEERFREWTSSFTSALINIKDSVHTLFKTPRLPTRYVTRSPPDVTVKMDFDEVTTMKQAKTEKRNLIKLEPITTIATPQLAATHGRKVEAHIVTTIDGYVLTMHRLTSPKANKYKNKYQTVILNHGLLGSSADWILLGSNDSLPYLLNDAGYDVWMANARGNYYSRAHVKKKISSADFWNFSFQEMGEFDLVAIIDYVRKVKNSTRSTEKIDFIGHSMGATALLVLLSTLPNYNDYLRMGILLAPLGFMTNIEGPLKSLTLTKTPDNLLRVIGKGEFVPTRALPKWVALKYCAGPLIFCCNPVYFLSGGIREASSWNSSFTNRVLYQVPAGGSTKTILHYAQLATSEKFHRYNNKNDEFNLNHVTLPIALINSDDDWLATTSDVVKLYFSISNPIDHHTIREKNFSHTDFVWGLKAKNLVFGKIFQYLDIGAKWSLYINEV